MSKRKRSSRKRGKLSPASINLILVGVVGLGWWAGIPEQVLFVAGMALTVSILGGLIRDYISMGPVAWVMVVVVFGGLWLFALKLDPTATPSSIVDGNCVGIFCWRGW